MRNEYLQQCEHKLCEWYEKLDKKSIKECSRENYKGHFLNSEIKVIDFDDVAKKQASRFGIERHRSNDSLLKVGNDYYFIEFKNREEYNFKCEPGVSRNTRKELDKKRKLIEQIKLKEKIYSSFCILEKELGIPIWETAKFSYILVYAESDKKGKINSSIGAKMDLKKRDPKFDLKKFKGNLFNEVYTVSKKEFERNLINRLIP